MMRLLAGLVLAIGVGTAATISAQAQEPSEPADQRVMATQLLRVGRLSDAIAAVSVFRQSRPDRQVTVWLHGVTLDASGKTSGGKGQPLEQVQTAAYVLRRDGSLVPQRSRSTERRCHATICTSMARFDFDDVQPSELVGVVVMAEGKMYAREIKQR